MSKNALEQVAGGAKNDLIIQDMMNKEGFNKKWLNGPTEKGQSFDSDFIDFMVKECGYERIGKFVERYGNQINMFN